MKTNIVIFNDDLPNFGFGSKRHWKMFSDCLHNYGDFGAVLPFLIDDDQIHWHYNYCSVTFEFPTDLIITINRGNNVYTVIITIDSEEIRNHYKWLIKMAESEIIDVPMDEAIKQLRRLDDGSR